MSVEEIDHCGCPRLVHPKNEKTIRFTIDVHAGQLTQLQTVLHAKAKEEPDRRFHALIDNLGQVNTAYKAIDRHATKRRHQWLCRKHNTKSGKIVRFPDARLGHHYGLKYLEPTTKGLPWATA